MFQVRIHGRGGQGVVTAAELLSVAAFKEGRHAQAFPSFGSERMGAPVVSYCRIDDKAIRLREPISEPDAVIIQDPTLLLGGEMGVFSGLKPGGYVLINTLKNFADLGLADFVAGLDPSRIGRAPATEMALKYVKRPAPNAPLLGAFTKVTGQVQQESVEAALKLKFPGKVGEANVAAVRAAIEAVRIGIADEETAHA